MLENTYNYPNQLAPQLVPSTAWGSNLRAVLSATEWKKVRLRVIDKHGAFCHFCNSKPKTLDCHEVWAYTHGELNIQTLTQIIPLCKNCHAVCHIGFWSLQGLETYERIKKHFCKVRKISAVTAEGEISNAFKIHEQMSTVEWVLDISQLKTIVE